MHRARTEPESAAPPRPDRRRWIRRLALSAGVAAVLLVAGWLLVPGLSWSSDEDMPMMHELARADFTHDVTEKGSVESASNFEVRCEVQSMKTAGTMILEIVPEGTYVEEGDFLVRLDSSWLESDLTKQQIVCAQSQAAVTEAQNALDTATINRKEYLEGQYRLEEKKIQNEILLASQEDSRSRENLVYSERLAAKGYITKLQLDAESFAVEKAFNDLEAAKLKLKVLQEYTKVKQLKQLESDLKTAEARLAARKHSYELDQEQLRRIETQIAKCEIRAEKAGEVVYANITDYRGGSEVIIEPGTLVREHQVIIRLPDPKNMQVKAKINEARISLVRAGMPAAIRLDAFPDAELTGEVKSVSDYPAPTSWHRGDVKEYETLIRIDNPPQGLKPGLTAQVQIRVEELDEALQAPVQAVLEHGLRHYCVVRNGRAWEAREVRLGPSNDKFVVICEVLEVPAPALFEFAGRPFVLLSSGPKWESRAAEVVSEADGFATVRLAGASATAKAQAVFELRGKRVRLLFDGAQWSARPVEGEAPGQHYPTAAPLPVPMPVQPVFDLDGRRFCVESEAQQWTDLREALHPKPEETSSAGSSAGSETRAEPGPSPEPAKPAPERAQAALQAGTGLGPAVQQWTAREVTVGSDPDGPGRIGVGLTAGEQVVLNAAAYREKIALPELPSDAKAKRKPGELDRPRPKADTPKAPTQTPAQTFRILDRNRDKRLSKDELPAALQPHFAELDQNKDGVVDLAEWVAAKGGLRSKADGDGAAPKPGP